MAGSQFVVVLALIGCAAAIPQIAFPALKAFKRNGLSDLHAAHAAKLQVRAALSTDEKCDILYNAYLALSNSISGNMHDPQVASMRDQVLQSTGVDVANPEGLREASCELAEIDSIAEFAARAGLPEAQMRAIYPSLVDSIQTVRAMLSDESMMAYLPANYQSIMRACSAFYDAMDTVGLLSLS